MEALRRGRVSPVELWLELCRGYSAIDARVVTRPASERVIRLAFEMAMKRQGAPKDGKHRVSCIVKNNVLDPFSTLKEMTDKLGELQVSDAELPMAGAEDFAYFAAEVPSAYFFLGAGREGEDTPGCHHPDFDFDDDLLELGVRMFAGLVRARVGAS